MRKLVVRKESLWFSCLFTLYHYCWKNHFMFLWILGWNCMVYTMLFKIFHSTNPIKKQRDCKDFNFWFYFISHFQCCQIIFDRFRHLGTRNSPKSPPFWPIFAHFSPILLNFCHFLTPSTILITFLCGNVWKNWNFTIFFQKCAMWNNFNRIWKNWEMKAQKTAQLFISFLSLFWKSPKMVEKKNLKIFGIF